MVELRLVGASKASGEICRSAELFTLHGIIVTQVRSPLAIVCPVALKPASCD
jgi:hypothetical protein